MTIGVNGTRYEHSLNSQIKLILQASRMRNMSTTNCVVSGTDDEFIRLRSKLILSEIEGHYEYKVCKLNGRSAASI